MCQHIPKSVVAFSGYCLQWSTRRPSKSSVKFTEFLSENSIYTDQCKHTYRNICNQKSSHPDGDAMTYTQGKDSRSYRLECGVEVS